MAHNLSSLFFIFQLSEYLCKTPLGDILFPFIAVNFLAKIHVLYAYEIAHDWEKINI